MVHRRRRRARDRRMASRRASVVFLFALAQWLEARTLERARQAIRALLDLAPREALVRRGGVEQRVPVETVAAGRDRHRPSGRQGAVDGVVVGGPQRRERGADHRRVAAGGQGRRRTKSTPARSTATARSTLTRHARRAATRAWRASSTWWRRRRRAARRCSRSSIASAASTRRLVIAGGAGRGRRAAAGRRADRVGVDLSALVLLVIVVPVRARDLDAGVDRGGAVGRRAPRRAGQGRRGARAPGRGAMRWRSTRPAR